MRSPNLGTMSYQPGQVPDDPSDLPRYLRAEMTAIAAALRQLADGHLDVQFKAPVKPRRGDIRYADGIQWNPGGGEGIYYFNGGGTWTQLG